MIVGLDCGYGYVKLAAPGRNDSFPSVVGKGRAPRFKTALGDGNGKKMIIDMDGQTYFVGDYALSQARYVWDTRDRGRIDTTEFKILVEAALSRIVGQNPQLNVITGLPAEHFNEESRARLESLLVGTHNVKMAGRKPRHFRVLTARTVVQHFGGFCDHMLNKKGEWLCSEARDIALHGAVGIVDIGRYTTGVVLFSELEYNEPRSTSIDIGMAAVHEGLVMGIEKKYGMHLSLYESDRALVQGFVQVEGKQKKLGKLADPYLQDLSETIASEIKSLWGDAKKLDTILISGGGASTVGALVARRYPHAKILGNGMMANARGFLKLGLHGEK